MQSAMHETPTVRLGQRLRQARLARNLTQSEVAQNQFSVSYISAVERGQIRPSLGALEKLSERLQVPVADLLRVDEGIAAGVLPRAEFFPMGPGAERDEVEVQLRESQILMQQGQPQQAIQILTALRSRGLSAREQALVGWRLAQCYIALKYGDQVRAEAQEALLLAERLNDPELRERVRLALAEGLGLVNKHQAALDQLRLAREAIEGGAVRDPVFRLDVLYLMGSAQWQLGDLEGAIATLSEAAATANDVLIPERIGALYAQLAEQYRLSGDGRRARLYSTHSLAAYEDAANRRLARQVLTRLGRAYAQSGQAREATSLLESARERAELQQDPRALAETLSALAGIYLKEERTDDAARTAQRAIEFADSIKDAVLQAEAQLVLAQVLEAKDDEKGAERNFEDAVRRLRAADATYPLSDAYAQYSAFLERRGNSKKALDILKQAWQLREHSTSNPH
jgi:transcriptional regulator with XRE-family HTH domain